MRHPPNAPAALNNNEPWPPPPLPPPPPPPLHPSVIPTRDAPNHSEEAVPDAAQVQHEANSTYGDAGTSIGPQTHTFTSLTVEAAPGDVEVDILGPPCLKVNAGDCIVVGTGSDVEYCKVVNVAWKPNGPEGNDGIAYLERPLRKKHSVGTVVIKVVNQPQRDHFSVADVLSDQFHSPFDTHFFRLDLGRMLQHREYCRKGWESWVEEFLCLKSLIQSVDVLFPLFMVCLICICAVVRADQSSDLLSADYNIVDGTMSDGVTMGIEAHELSGAVLAFILGLVAQAAAEDYKKGATQLEDMMHELESFARVLYVDIRTDEFIREIKLHWELHRLLCMLFVFSCRELQESAFKGGALTESKAEKLVGRDLDLTGAERRALSSVRNRFRVPMILTWVEVLLKRCRDDEFTESTRSVECAFDCLQAYDSKYQEACTVARVKVGLYFMVVLKLCLYMFCCTIPFPLVTTQGAWAFPSSLVVTLCYFTLYKAAGKSQNPFGFDDCDLDLQKYCTDFQQNLAEICDISVPDSTIIPWTGAGSSKSNEPFQNLRSSINSSKKAFFQGQLDPISEETTNVRLRSPASVYGGTALRSWINSRQNNPAQPRSYPRMSRDRHSLPPCPLPLSQPSTRKQ